MHEFKITWELNTMILTLVMWTETSYPECSKAIQFMCMTDIVPKHTFWPAFIFLQANLL